MATTNTWAQVVKKISGVVNRGAFSKTFTPTTSAQSSTGSAGYYSSVTTKCNAVSLSGNAAVGNVLRGKTFYTTSLTKQTGTMVNRGALNWSPTTSTSYTVSSGYYSGGTLKSSGVWSAAVAAADARVNTSSASYTSGYNAGKDAIYGRDTYNIAFHSGIAPVTWLHTTGGIQLKNVTGNGYIDAFVVFDRVWGTAPGQSFTVTNGTWKIVANHVWDNYHEPNGATEFAFWYVKVKVTGASNATAYMKISHAFNDMNWIGGMYWYSL